MKMMKRMQGVLILYVVFAMLFVAACAGNIDEKYVQLEELQITAEDADAALEYGPSKLYGSASTSIWFLENARQYRIRGLLTEGYDAEGAWASIAIVSENSTVFSTNVTVDANNNIDLYWTPAFANSGTSALRKTNAISFSLDINNISHTNTFMLVIPASNQPCVFYSYWTDAQGNRLGREPNLGTNETVLMETKFTGDVSKITNVEYVIWEDDGTTGDDPLNDPLTDISPTLAADKKTAAGQWQTLWGNDALFGGNTLEWYFRVHLYSSDGGQIDLLDSNIIEVEAK